MANKLRFKRGSNLANAGTPAEGEPLYNTTTGEFFIGDGTTSASSLTAIGGSGNTWRPVTAGGNSLSTTETLAFTAGSNVTISESGGAVTIGSTDTTYSTMGSGNSYASGLVPTGSATHGDTYLRKDGTWGTPTDTNTTYSLVSTSADGLAPTLPASHGGKFLRGDGTWVVPPDTDTVYTHPTGDGNLHVPATGTTNNGKVLTAGSTAGSLSWVTPTTYTSSDFTHDSLSGVTANEHIDWTIDQGTTNIHSGNYTDTNTWRPLGTGASDACAGNDARLSDARTPTAHTHDYTSLDHFRSLGTTAFTGTATTAGLISEMEGDGAFDSYTSAFKTSWSYAGNFNLSDAGRFTETAGTSFLTWTDNSSDSTRGNITVLAIAPNTGGSAGKMFVYNDQGSGYSPGWREIWTSTSDGSGSGLDADLLDGVQGSSFLRSDTSDTATGNLTFTGSVLINRTAHNYFQVHGNGGYEAMTQYKNSNSNYWYTGLRTSSGINDTASFHIYSAAYGADVFGVNTSGVAASASQGTLWGSSNDGSGSGLDADLLDGQQGSYYNHRGYTVDNNYLGGYYVSGGSEKPNDAIFGAGKLKIAMLGNGNLGFGGSWNDVLWISTYTGGDVKRSTALVSSKYDNTSVWVVKQNYDSLSWGTGYLFWNSGNDGSGSGLDADLLDGSGWLDYGRDIHANQVIADDWLRTTGNAGWYSNTHGGGWYMQDSTWIRAYNGKYVRAPHFYQDGAGGYCVSTSGTSSNYIQKGNASYRVQNTTMTDDGSTISTSGHTLKVEGGSMGSVFARPTGYTTAWTRRSGRMGIYRTPEGYDTCLLYHYDGSTLRWTSGTAYKGGGQNLDWTLIKDYDQYVTSGGVWRNPTIRASTNGNIYSATGSFNNSSDERLKRNITDLTKGLEHIKQMRPITYNRYLPDDDKVMDKTEVGFIAQEMLEIGLDEVVEGNNEDAKYYTLNYGSVTAYLVKAMQEMVEKIESLETKIEEMQNGT